MERRSSLFKDVYFVLERNCVHMSEESRSWWMNTVITNVNDDDHGTFTNGRSTEYADTLVLSQWSWHNFYKSCYQSLSS